MAAFAGFAFAFVASQQSETTTVENSVLKCRMPQLTRRRSDNPHQETWHIYFGILATCASARLASARASLLM